MEDSKDFESIDIIFLDIFSLCPPLISCNFKEEDCKIFSVLLEKEVSL